MDAVADVNVTRRYNLNSRLVDSTPPPRMHRTGTGSSANTGRR